MHFGIIRHHEYDIYNSLSMIRFIIFSLHISGVMYQVAAEITVTKQNKLRSNIDVLAGGYRYDKLVSYLYPSLFLLAITASAHFVLKLISNYSSPSSPMMQAIAIQYLDK